MWLGTGVIGRTTLQRKLPHLINGFTGFFFNAMRLFSPTPQLSRLHPLLYLSMTGPQGTRDLEVDTRLGEAPCPVPGTSGIRDAPLEGLWGLWGEGRSCSQMEGVQEY